MQILQKKREQFRFQTRKQAHQALFQQNRISFGSQDKNFENFLDFLKYPCIQTSEDLTLFNTSLLEQINHDIPTHLICDIEQNIDKLLSSLIKIIYERNQLQEVLTILTNLTFLSESIAKKLMKYEYGGFNFLQLLQLEIIYGAEKTKSLQVLQNLWSCPISHQIDQFDMIKILMELAEISCSQNNIEILLLIVKCCNNLLNSMRDHSSLIDFSLMLKTIKLILAHSITDSLSPLEDSLEFYLTFTHTFSFPFLVQDQQLILKILMLNNHTEQICKLCIYLYFNEPLEFRQILLTSVIQFCKNIITQQLPNQISNILNMCSILFDSQHQTNNEMFSLFYGDQVLIQSIIQFTSDCYPKPIIVSAVNCIQNLIENSNTTQIKYLIRWNLHKKLLKLLQKNILDERHLFQVSESINNLHNAVKNILNFQNLNSISLTSYQENEIPNQETLHEEEIQQKYQEYLFEFF